jgi:cathepsin L
MCMGTIGDNPNPAESWDWANKAVSAVQTEGNCGSSWAFSATGALEGAYALSRGRIIKVSDQQLVDCSQIYGNNGCNGGFMDQAFWYVIDNGIALAEVYPYSGKASKCIYKSSLKYFRITDCIDIVPKNYSKLISAVLHAPVSVAVDATNFRFYNDGVFDRSCDTSLNRGVTQFINLDAISWLWNVGRERLLEVEKFSGDRLGKRWLYATEKR